MISKRVLIVEDDPVVSIDVEQELIAAGYEICGLASNELDALAIGHQTHPELAIVDVNLAPGDGRKVARELVRRYQTTVVMATAHCESRSFLSGFGATACLPKPYNAGIVAAALRTADALADGRDPGVLPGNLIILN